MKKQRQREKKEAARNQEWNLFCENHFSEFRFHYSDFQT